MLHQNNALTGHVPLGYANNLEKSGAYEHAPDRVRNGSPYPRRKGVRRAPDPYHDDWRAGHKRGEITFSVKTGTRARPGAYQFPPRSRIGAKARAAASPESLPRTEAGAGRPKLAATTAQAPAGERFSSRRPAWASE